jgi:molecular chaperone GrpE
VDCRDEGAQIVNEWNDPADAENEAAESAVPPIPEPGDKRAAIVARFAKWLDDTLDNEAAEPEHSMADLLAELDPSADASGAPREDGRDLYALYAAMTALTQEVKLQGRAFKQLGDALEPVRDMRGAIDELLGAHGAALAEARRIADEAHAQRAAQDRALATAAERKAQRALLAVLVDLHERLQRAGAPAAELVSALDTLTQPSWRARLAGMRAPIANAAGHARAAAQGHALCLARFEDALSDFGVRAIPCLGLPFDPLRMNATDVQETDTAPDGVVLEVYRAGYEWHDEILQLAQVKVARNRRTP